MFFVKFGTLSVHFEARSAFDENLRNHQTIELKREFFIQSENMEN